MASSCNGNCTSTCTGCFGSCSGTCEGSCSATCSSLCAGSCAGSNGILTASDMNTLKAKVKAEMQRRAYNGPLTSFASTSYDFSTAPTSKSKITADQGKKVIEPLLQITDRGNLNIADLKTGSKIPSSFNKDLIDYVDGLASESVTAASSSCRGACSGLCVGTCGVSCSGCQSCSGGCTGNGGSGGSGGSGSSGCGGCSGNCGGGCNGCAQCDSGCSTSCIGTCGAGCNGSCSSCDGCSGCSGSCSDNCSASGKGATCSTCFGCTGCQSTCSTCSSCGGCAGCTACSGTCTGGCSNVCSGSCNSECTTGCYGCSGCSGGCTGCSSGCSGCTGCGTGCYGSCTGFCDGCSGNCSGGCINSCFSKCTSTCTGTCQAQAFGAVASGWPAQNVPIDLVANNIIIPTYTSELYKNAYGHSYSRGDDYVLTNKGISVLYDKANKTIVFDFYNGLKMTTNTLFTAISGLDIPIFVIRKDSNIKYNPSGLGSSDNKWPPISSSVQAPILNTSDKQHYQIKVNGSDALSQGTGIGFYLSIANGSATKNAPQNGDIIKGTKRISIAFEITNL